jgi:hypothetical protein
VALLAHRLRRRDTGHGGDERLVVSQERELPTFKQKPEMPDGEEGREEFPVECRVLDLR